MTAPAPVNPPAPPWYDRLRLLQALLALLVVVAIAEAALVYSSNNRVERLVSRMEDLRVAEELELGSSVGTLLLITSDDVGFNVRDLRRAQARVHVWVDTFGQQQGLEPAVVELLHGVMARYLVEYGNTRVKEALGGVAPDDLQARYVALHDRYRQTVAAILSKEASLAFDDEIQQNWQTWIAE